MKGLKTTAKILAVGLIALPVLHLLAPLGDDADYEPIPLERVQDASGRSYLRDASEDANDNGGGNARDALAQCHAQASAASTHPTPHNFPDYNPENGWGTWIEQDGDSWLVETGFSYRGGAERVTCELTYDYGAYRLNDLRWE